MNENDELRAPAELGLGASGKFPRGKISKDDEGELRMAVRAFPEKGIVALDFGKQVSWLGLDKAVAIQLGHALIAEAGKLPQ
jgi:hypothetical protein